MLRPPMFLLTLTWWLSGTGAALARRPEGGEIPTSVLYGTIWIAIIGCLGGAMILLGASAYCAVRPGLRKDAMPSLLQAGQLAAVGGAWLLIWMVLAG